VAQLQRALKGRMSAPPYPPPRAPSPSPSQYAVSNHHGGMGGGHYTAYAKGAGDWFLLNDAHCSRVDPADVCSADAYVLFFTKMVTVQRGFRRQSVTLPHLWPHAVDVAGRATGALTADDFVRMG
jgi:hypothetical protein